MMINTGSRVDHGLYQVPGLKNRIRLFRFQSCLLMLINKS